jgi:hypothetical protein
MRSSTRTAVFALTAAAVALASPAVATGETKEWDIGAYDQCWNSGIGKGFTDEEFQDHVHHCCVNSGGIWTGTKCVAPPKDEPKASTTRWPADLPVQVFEPMRPTSRVVDVVDAPVFTAEG